jgi:hypothetical protein
MTYPQLIKTKNTFQPLSRLEYIFIHKLISAPIHYLLKHEQFIPSLLNYTEISSLETIQIEPYGLIFHKHFRFFIRLKDKKNTKLKRSYCPSSCSTIHLFTSLYSR